MPRCDARRRSGHVFDVFAIENDTSGGSRLTEVNDDAASPMGRPSMVAATATTPLGNTPNACRSATGSRSWFVARLVGLTMSSSDRCAEGHRGAAGYGRGMAPQPAPAQLGQHAFAEPVRLFQVRI